MKRSWIVRSAQGIITLALVAASFVSVHGTAQARTRAEGAVFALTNAVNGNAVVMYDRAHDGSLTQVGSFPTGGSGTGSGLGSQGALVLSPDRHWLFAVNAGSNEISVFSVKNSRLRLVERVSSGGVQPISLTFDDDLLYVLNAGEPATITGFVFDDGELDPLPSSTQPLSQPAPGPAQVSFSPDGDMLVVTEKAANLIDVFEVDDGIAQPAQTIPSAGVTPFGFTFDKRGHLIVSEANGGAAGAGTASSYDLDEDDGLEVVTGALQTGQGAPCWAITTRNGRYAYIANTASGTLTAFRIDRHGQLHLLQPDGVAAITGAGSAPADLALSRNSHFLYVRNGGNGTIGAFAIGRDGTLSPIAGASGLPSGSAGLVAF
jgi:6-phosphogluconolactonase